jgi:hypothetical protein
MCDPAGNPGERVAARFLGRRSAATSLGLPQPKNRHGLPQFVQGRLLEDSRPVCYPKKPKLLVGKFARFGKILGRSAAATPNHDASVAAY